MIRYQPFSILMTSYSLSGEKTKSFGFPMYLTFIFNPLPDESVNIADIFKP